MRRLVIGDIHGNFEALKRVVANAKLDPVKDRVFCLGDVVDGPAGRDVYACIEWLTTLKHLKMILGNHDWWALQHFEARDINPQYEYAPWVWTTQGGDTTIASYHKHRQDGLMPMKHIKLFKRAKLYHITKDGVVFVHGGFPYNGSPAMTDDETLMWDRKLISDVKNKGPTSVYKHIFVGHSTTQMFKSVAPLTFGNLTMMDTGAGWDGKLSIMDVDTHDIWQDR